jgi:uncharacterized membrane protein/protein-disulfide isomerase
MNYSLDQVLSRWFKLLKISVAKSYLKEQLLSHPDYPSLLSITDILDDLNIENSAIEIKKEQLPEIPVPFMAHLKSNGGEFVIVNNRNDLDRQFSKFFERWSGVVVLAEKPDGWQHLENNHSLQKKKQKTFANAAFITVLAAFIIASSLLTWQWQQTSLLFIAAAGIFISWLIVSKDLGIENKIGDEVCGKQDDCSSIIKSKGAKLPLGISWSDVGMIWFSFLLLLLLINSFEKTLSGFYILISLLFTFGLPFTIFSVYYQWRVKKWCRLCLITVGLLWLQFLILIPQWQQITNWKFDWNNLILSGLILVFVSSTWFAVKSLLKSNKKLESENFVHIRFKNNPDVFTSLLQKQKKIDTTPFENDLQLGNADADLQILVACNPYCTPCAKAHKVLHELVEKNNIGLTVRFAIKTENKEDKRLKAAEYILQLLTDKSIDYKRKVFHDWYEWMDMEKFQTKYFLQKNGTVDVLLEKYEAWSEEAEIQFTPAIFINGHESPKQYNVEYLKFLVKEIPKKRKTETTESVNEFV